jgi:MFS family permease
VRLIVAGLAAWSAVTFFTGRVESFAQLLTARAAMGLNEAFYLPAALALIANHHGEAARGRATGLHYSGIYAGMVIGGAGAGWS